MRKKYNILVALVLSLLSQFVYAGKVNVESIGWEGTCHATSADTCNLGKHPNAHHGEYYSWTAGGFWNGQEIGTCWSKRKHPTLPAIEPYIGYATFFDCDSSCPDAGERIKGVCTTNNGTQKGPPPENSCVGNPINISNGNKFQVETDYLGTGEFPISFRRIYNSLDGLWRHNYSTHLNIAGDKITLVMFHGRESQFTISGTSVTAGPLELGLLTKITDGWQYTADNNERFTFNIAGRLVHWSNNAGAGHRLNYVNDNITITDNLGQTLSFTEDALHQPLTLIATALNIQYEYNANQRLSKFTRTRDGQSEQRLYHYEIANKSHLLTGITDERGIRYATWAYDDKNRAISSEHADGMERIEISYEPDGSSILTNELGKKTHYRFQKISGINRIISINGKPSANCPNSNSTFTYNTRGQVISKVDNKYNRTAYTYNARGQEISRTEAYLSKQSRVITTTWHPTLFLPLTVTEPARITTYTYDAQGRLLSQSVTQR